MVKMIRLKKKRPNATVFTVVLILFLFCGLIATVIVFSQRGEGSNVRRTTGIDLSDHIPMDLIAFAENRRLANTDIVSTPQLTIFGKVPGYQAIRGSHPGFDILVNGTSASITPTSGEFAQPITLQTGKNLIDISVKWGDRVHERFSYDVTYQATSTIAR